MDAGIKISAFSTLDFVKPKVLKGVHSFKKKNRNRNFLKVKFTPAQFKIPDF